MKPEQVRHRVPCSHVELCKLNEVTYKYVTVIQSPRNIDLIHLSVLLAYRSYTLEAVSRNLVCVNVVYRNCTVPISYR